MVVLTISGGRGCGAAMISCGRNSFKQALFRAYQANETPWLPEP